MKCVRVVGQGTPVRLSNEEAFQLVERDKDGEYCPKHVWREFYAMGYWVERGGRAMGYASLSDKKLKRLA